jgi:hypothetical protein
MFNWLKRLLSPKPSPPSVVIKSWGPPTFDHAGPGPAKTVEAVPGKPGVYLGGPSTSVFLKRPDPGLNQTVQATRRLEYTPPPAEDVNILAPTMFGYGGYDSTPSSWSGPPERTTGYDSGPDAASGPAEACDSSSFDSGSSDSGSCDSGGGGGSTD